MTSQIAMPSVTALTQQTVQVKVVDIGANPIDGDPPYAGLMRNDMADIVGFEPNRDALGKLNARKGPRETYLPYAIGDGRRHTLHICGAPGMTSLMKPNASVLKLFHGFPMWGQVLSTEDVDTVRLDDVAETAGVDLIKMDIQGAELMVLENANARLEETLVIQTEVEFLPLYENQPLFADIELFLRKQGFVFHRFFPVVSRVIQPLSIGNDMYAGLSQLVWADAIFVRDFTRPHLLSPDQLLKSAAIVHECYRSLDLVLHLLVEYDRRMGSRLAPTYLAGLQQSAPIPSSVPAAVHG